MAELVIMLIASILGFVIGGIVGELQIHAWFPYAWYGLAIVWGVSVAGIAGCHSSTDW